MEKKKGIRERIVGATTGEEVDALLSELKNYECATPTAKRKLLRRCKRAADLRKGKKA